MILEGGHTSIYHLLTKAVQDTPWCLSKRVRNSWFRELLAPKAANTTPCVPGSKLPPPGQDDDKTPGAKHLP